MNTHTQHSFSAASHGGHVPSAFHALRRSTAGPPGPPPRTAPRPGPRSPSWRGTASRPGTASAPPSTAPPSLPRLQSLLLAGGRRVRPVVPQHFEPRGVHSRPQRLHEGVREGQHRVRHLDGVRGEHRLGNLEDHPAPVHGPAEGEVARDVVRDHHGMHPGDGVEDAAARRVVPSRDPAVRRREHPLLVARRAPRAGGERSLRHRVRGDEHSVALRALERPQRGPGVRLAPQRALRAAISRALEEGSPAFRRVVDDAAGGEQSLRDGGVRRERDGGDDVREARTEIVEIGHRGHRVVAERLGERRPEPELLRQVVLGEHPLRGEQVRPPRAALASRSPPRAASKASGAASPREPTPGPASPRPRRRATTSPAAPSSPRSPPGATRATRTWR